MKNFIIGWILGRALSDENNRGTNGLIEFIGQCVILLFILAGIGIWYKFCVWITSFAGPLGPFVGVFVPILIITLSGQGSEYKLSLISIMLFCAVLSILFLLFIMWYMDYI